MTIIEQETKINRRATRTPVTLWSVLRTAIVTTLATVAISAAAFGAVAMLVDQWSLDLMTYGAPSEDAGPPPPDAFSR